LAYDAAARRIRGTAAVTNFNEVETEEMVRMYGEPVLPETDGGPGSGNLGGNGGGGGGGGHNGANHSLSSRNKEYYTNTNSTVSGLEGTSAPTSSNRGFAAVMALGAAAEAALSDDHLGHSMGPIGSAPATFTDFGGRGGRAGVSPLGRGVGDISGVNKTGTILESNNSDSMGGGGGNGGDDDDEMMVGAMDEEIAEILLHMRVADSNSPSASEERAPVAANRRAATNAAAAAAAHGAADASSIGRRYGTRTAAGLKVGRSYTDLLND
jgi:hypothetical protein